MRFLPSSSRVSQSMSNRTLLTVMASFTVHGFHLCVCLFSNYPVLLTPTPTTVPTAPTPPRLLTMTGEPNGSTIELNWLPPLHPNGAIHYEIEYEPAVTPGDPVNAKSSSSPYFTLTLPSEFLTYNVRVAAVNTQGRAQSSNVVAVCPGMNRQSGMYVCKDMICTYML